MKLNESAII